MTNRGRIIVSKGGWQRLRQRVIDRAMGQCDLCTLPIQSEWQCHHRRLRSQGGDDALHNLLCLHGFCHWSVHVRDNRWATAHGFLVPSYADARAWPVLQYRSRWRQPGEQWVEARPLPGSAQQGLIDAFNLSGTRAHPDPAVQRQAFVDGGPAVDADSPDPFGWQL